MVYRSTKRSIMAKLTKVKADQREAALEAASKAGAKTLAGGLNLPEGTYPFQVADKGAFGILEVESAASGKWALPIVAGTMKVNGKTETFVLSDEPGAKTLVIPDAFYTAMQNNAIYNITIGSRKGRKVVTGVEPAEAGASTEDDE